MKVNDILTVTVEKIADSSSGIAKSEGFVIFIDGACPKDVLKVRITKVNKTSANGVIEEIIEPSPYRVSPFCPMQKVCGACQIQYIDYDYQLKIKKQIVEDAMKSIAGLNVEIRDVVPSNKDKNYRHKVQYPISQTKVSQRILAGYYKAKSHEVVNIKYCPIQPQICDEIIDFIRNKAFDFAISGFNEKKHSGDLRHVILRVSKANGSVLVVLVVNATKTFDRLNDFAKEIYKNFKCVSGVCINFNSKKTNVIMGNKTECVVGKEFIEEKIDGKIFRIGANSFFQVNPYTAENIFKYVRDYIQNNFKKPLVLDAYAGVATFGMMVSDISKKVISVEENIEASRIAHELLKINKINNLEFFNMDTQKFLERDLTKRKKKYDVVILDPPRKGCSKTSLELVSQLLDGKLIYVSCNPATLARDLKYLCEKGGKVEFIQPFDMFCHSVHVESVAVISFENK